MGDVGGTVAGRDAAQSVHLFTALDAGDDCDTAAGAGDGHSEGA